MSGLVAGFGAASRDDVQQMFDRIAHRGEFLSVYGLTESALDVLCDLIDDEGMTRDFASQLKEHGVAIEAVDADGDDVDSIEDEMG